MSPEDQAPFVHDGGPGAPEPPGELSEAELIRRAVRVERLAERLALIAEQGGEDRDIILTAAGRLLAGLQARLAIDGGDEPRTAAYRVMTNAYDIAGIAAGLVSRFRNAADEIRREDTDPMPTPAALRGGD